MWHKSLYVPVYASNTAVKRDYENCCPHGLLFVNKALKCGEVRMLMTPFLESRALSKFTHKKQGKDHSGGGGGAGVGLGCIQGYSYKKLALICLTLSKMPDRVTRNILVHEIGSRGNEEFLLTSPVGENMQARF